MATALFAAAPYRALPDPRDRVLGYVDFRAAMLAGDIPQYTCLLGTMVQEVYDTHPAIAAACDRGMSSHVRELARDIELAKDRYAPGAGWSAESVGYHMQAVLQGAFIFTKAKHDPAVARDCLAHLRRYIESLFPIDAKTPSPH
jgi:TetR/AcrR family transcriptional repressor of nem operon